nr:MAG TPA: hypothetical protein [Caudoviricetes sp.]
MFDQHSCKGWRKTFFRDHITYFLYCIQEE